MVELAAIVLAVQTWAAALRGQRVPVHTDSTVAARAVKRGWAQCPHMHRLLEALFITLATFDIRLYAQVLACQDNQRAD